MFLLTVLYIRLARPFIALQQENIFDLSSTFGVLLVILPEGDKNMISVSYNTAKVDEEGDAREGLEFYENVGRTVRLRGIYE